MATPMSMMVTAIQAAGEEPWPGCSEWFVMPPV
jgi:hypothetical protein